MFAIVDLTRPLTRRSLSYPGDRVGVAAVTADAGTPNVRVTHLTHLDMHLGTHIDAPLHFIPGGLDVASLELALRPAVVVRTRERAVPLSVLPTQSLRDCAVLFETGWTIDAESPAYFEGFPHLSPELAAELVHRGVALVGIDSPSADPADSALECPAHHILLGAGIPIVEGLCNLDRIREEPVAFWFAVFPLRLEGAEGSPVRAVALFASPENPERKGQRSIWTK
ncbi:MAG: cyclase family protein [Thermotogota bacterium]